MSLRVSMIVRRVPRMPLLVGVGLALVLAACSDSASIPLSGADDDPGAVEAFEAVEAAYAEYNSGDARTWTEIRDRGSIYESSEVQQGVQDTITEAVKGEQAADGLIDVSGCESHGLGEWPVSDVGTAAGYYFTCDAVRSNSFHGAADLELTELYEWVVAGGEVVAVGSDEPGGDEYFEFAGGFDTWLNATHPDVWADMEFVRFGAVLTLFPAEESVPSALDYVDEYADSRA